MEGVKGKVQRERERGRESLCFKRNMMLKKADRQKTSPSVVAMVTTICVLAYPTPKDYITW